MMSAVDVSRSELEAKMQSLGQIDIQRLQPSNVNWCKRSSLLHQHHALFGQFQAGTEGAGQGRAPAQRPPLFVL
jgi:hypothetical protein